MVLPLARRGAARRFARLAARRVASRRGLVVNANANAAANAEEGVVLRVGALLDVAALARRHLGRDVRLGQRGWLLIVVKEVRSLHDASSLRARSPWPPPRRQK